jgi:hypothetical protein
LPYVSAPGEPGRRLLLLASANPNQKPERCLQPTVWVLRVRVRVRGSGSLIETLKPTNGVLFLGDERVSRRSRGQVPLVQARVCSEVFV